MQPFAVQKPAGSRLPWIILASVCAAFLIWHLDLLPKIRTVATGSLPAASAVGEFDQVSGERPWDAIVDRSHSRTEDPDPGDDPLLSALKHQTEPIIPGEYAPMDGGADLTPATYAELPADANARRDPGIQPASFEIPSEQPARSSAASTDSTPPVIPADLAAKLRQIDVLFRNDQITEAHASLSQLYWKQPELRGLIRSRLEHTAALLFTSPDVQFEDPYVVAFGDTLGSIAGKYQVSWPYLARLNRTSPERLQAGQSLKVVTGPFSAVVDLHDFALTVHAHGWFVHRYQIGIGADHRTPTGEFTVREKLENPVWYNPDGGQIAADDPANPLGEFWLGLGNHIGIHGTIDPGSIGTSRSRGCIHLADGDIEEVFHLLSVGSTVLIRN